MTVSNIESNSISWNALLAACEKGELWQSAVDSLRQMEQHRLSLTDISISTAMDACEDAGRHEQALALLWKAEARCFQTPRARRRCF